MFGDAFTWTTLQPIADAAWQVISAPVGIIVGIGILVMVVDMIIGRAAPSISESGGAGSGGPGAGRGARGRSSRHGGRSKGPLPTWKNEDFYTTDSWDDLQANARENNGWKG